MQVSTEQLFTQARTQNGFLPTAVSEEQLRALYDLVKWGPTSANCSPARFQFVRSARAKEKLIACVSPVKTNFICTLGEGDASKVLARSPRLAFEEACRLT